MNSNNNYKELESDNNGSNRGGNNLSKVDSSSFSESIGRVVDHELMIRQVIQKDPDAGFDLLFKKYYKPLCNRAIRYVYSKEIAEDLVSEIFAKMWAKRLYVNINSSTYRTYLFQALRNSIYNYFDKEFRDKEHHKKVLNSQLLFDGSNPHSILLFDELALKIQTGVNNLPPQCQKVFILSRIENKKNAEIATQLNITIKTVEAHLTKALSLLRTTIQCYFK